MCASKKNCFNSSFATVSVNGKYFGLYLEVENMDVNFLKGHLLPETGSLYKATKDGACMSIFDEIEKNWEKKTNKNESWDDLKELIEKVDTVSKENYYAFIQETFNYTDFVNMLTLNLYLANGSTYYHNYYLYHHPNGKWELLPWDMDKSLSYYDWMPYQYHRTSSEWESDNPLIERAFLNPQILSDIRSRIDELCQTSISPNAIIPIINDLERLLENSVKLDSSDQVTDLTVWKNYLEKERTGFLKIDTKKYKPNLTLGQVLFQ